jgi:hypothetical protein
MEGQIKEFNDNFVVKQTGFSERNKGWKVV